MCAVDGNLLDRAQDLDRVKRRTIMTPAEKAAAAAVEKVAGLEKVVGAIEITAKGVEVVPRAKKVEVDDDGNP